MSKERYSLTTDGDGHWYVVPLRKMQRFNKLLAEGEKDEWCEFINEFGEYAVGGSPTLVSFENPRWD